MHQWNHHPRPACASAVCPTHLSPLSAVVLASLLATSPAWAAQATTTTSLVSIPSTPSVGKSFTLQASVSPSSVAGPVTFREGTTVLGKVNLGSGRANFTVNAYSTVGQHTYTATYNDAGSTTSSYGKKSVSSPLVVYIKNTTTTSLSTTSSGTRPGDAITLTAKVSGGTPTGSVTFLDSGNELKTVPVTNGVAQLAVSFPKAGSHSFAAVYMGDTTTQTSFSSSIAVTQSGTNRDYFVSSAAGSDSNPGTETAPWATLAPVNSTAFATGDVVKFAAGGSWTGTIQAKPGVSYDMYGTASAKPIIRGSVNLATKALSWSVYSGNIYVADVSSVLVNETDPSGQAVTPAVGQLFFNGQRLQRARFPNVGAGVFNLGANRYARQGAQSVMIDQNTKETLTDSRGQTIPGINLDGRTVVPLLEVGANTFPADLQLTSNDLIGAEAYVRSADWYLSHYDVTDYGPQLDQNGQYRPGTDANGKPTAQGEFLSITRRSSLVSGDIPWAFGVWPRAGFWLENKLWMLDQPGEWVFDGQTKKLYVWMPDGSSPQDQSLQASVWAHGVVATTGGAVQLKNLQFVEPRGDAVYINHATTINAAGLNVARAGGRGIVVYNSTGGTATAHGALDGIAVTDTVERSIELAGDSTRYLDLKNSSVLNAGKDYFAWSAVALGEGSNATNNTISNSSYIGIVGAKDNTISGNTVINSCLQFDDCGGIYTIGRAYAYPGSTPNTVGVYKVGSTITGNFVIGVPYASARDRSDGLPDNPNGSATKGIYLDDYTTDVKVDGNFVTGEDYGVMLHFARNITVSNNTMGGNTVSQLWLQEAGGLPDSCLSDPACDAYNYMVNNVISGNLMANRVLAPQANAANGRLGSPNALITLNSATGNTADFGTFSSNRYAAFGDMTAQPAVFAYDLPLNQAGYVTSKNFNQWKASGRDTDSASAVYATAAGVQQPAANAASLLTNGDFESGMWGWSSWASFTGTTTAGCATAGTCVNAYGDPSAGQQLSNGQYNFIVNSNQTLSIVNGQRYLLSFDAKSDNAGESAWATVLRNECPDPDHGLCWDTATNTQSLTLSNNWQRYVRVLTATKDMPNVARVNFQFHAAGSVWLDNVKLVPLTYATGPSEPVLFYNSSASAISVNCPVTDTTMCNSYVDAKTGSAVSFPLSIAARSARVLATTVSKWADPDFDGVPGTNPSTDLDQCTATPDGQTVNEKGCALAP